MTTQARRRKPAETQAVDFQLPEYPQRVISFETKNVMGVKAAFVDTQGKHMVKIAGKNGQGKTSLLRSIEMALCGKSVFPVKTVHRGESYGTVEVQLTDIKVHLTVTHGGHTLRLSTSDGRPIKGGPQELLNKLFNELSFNPLKFATMKPPEQDAELMRFAGIEDARVALDTEYAQIFDERTEVNRMVTRLNGQIEGMPWHDDAPTEEVTAKSLLEQLKQMETIQRSNDSIRARAVQVGKELDQSVKDCTKIGKELEELEQQLAAKREDLHEASVRHAGLLKLEAAATAEIEKLEDPDTEGKRAEIASVDENNTKVRENVARVRVKKQLDQHSRESQAKTDRLQAIKNERLTLLENAKFPVPGLTFGEFGPELNGIPLKDVSMSDVIRLSCAIGFAQNPKLKLLVVRDAAFIDDEGGLELLEELAEEHDGLVILERVGTKDETAIIIEDGTVVREPVAAE